MRRQHFSVLHEPIEKTDFLELVQTKGFQTLLSMALECTAKSSFLFQKFCAFLLSGSAAFELSDEYFREIIKAHRRVFDNPKATFAFFRDLHKTFPKTTVNDSLLVFLINYAIENKLQNEALEMTEFYWNNPLLNLMQSTKSLYKIFKYFEDKRNRNEIEALCTKIVHYFERFPAQKIPIQLATILLNQYWVKLNVRCSNEIEQLIALIPAKDVDWKFRAQLIKTYARSNSHSEMEHLFTKHGYLIHYLAKYQQQMDNALAVLYKFISKDKFLTYLERIKSYSIQLKSLSWQLGFSQDDSSQMILVVQNSFVPAKFLEGLLAQHRLLAVELKLSSLYGHRKEIDILEYLLVERICRKFNLNNSFTPFPNERFALFNLARDQSGVESLHKTSLSPDNHCLIMEGILAGTDQLDKLKAYLGDCPEKKHQYWTERLNTLVLSCSEGWNFILNPLTN